MPITSKRASRSSGEDVDVVLAGTVTGGEVIGEVIFDPADCPPCSSARLMSTVFSFQTGLVATLYWEKEEDHDLITPLEGRGTLDFRPFQGLMNPRNDGWTGRVLLRVEGPVDGVTRHFALCLDLSKQRN